MLTRRASPRGLSFRPLRQALDIALLRMARTRGHHPLTERAVVAFTALGEHGGVWYALAGAGAALDRPRRGQYARAAVTVAIAYAANQLVKLVVRRRRPRLDDLPPLRSTHSQLSYPSAHATTSFAGARALAGAWPAAPLYGLAAAMALSRLYVGVHYPSDTVAGAALGTAVAELAA
jgi:membrane-associated phospholipid phosphatase